MENKRVVQPFKIHTDAEYLLACLFEIGQASPEIRSSLPGFPQSVSELKEMITVEGNDFGAVGASELVVNFVPTERLMKLVTAVRARCV